MKLVPIKVECHSGYKADEYPVCFYLEHIKYAIDEISDRWYQADLFRICRLPTTLKFVLAATGNTLSNMNWKVINGI